MYYKLERKNSHREIVAGSNNFAKWLGGVAVLGASVVAPAMFAEGASAAEIPAEDLTTSISQDELSTSEQAYQAEINAQLQQQAAQEEAARAEITQTVTTVSEQNEQSTPIYDVNTSEDSYFSFVKDGKVYVVGNVEESQYAEIAQQLRDKYGITDSEVYVYNSSDYNIGDKMTLEDDDNNHIIDIVKGENGNYVVTGNGLDQISNATLKEQTENTTEQKQQPVNENTQQNQHQNQGSSSTDVYETQDYKYNYNVTVGDSDYLLFKGTDGKYDIVFGGVGMSAGQISELEKQLVAEGKIPADANIVAHVIPDIGAGQKVDLSNSGYGEVMFGINQDGSYTLSSNENSEFANGVVKFENNKQLQDNADEYKDPDAEPLDKPVPETPTPDTPEPTPTPDTPEPIPEKPENPVQPKTPEQPVTPQQPVAPQAPVQSNPLASTGSETDMLGAMGLGAAGLGLALLAGAKRRRKYGLDKNGSNAVRFAQIPDEDLAILSKINNIDDSNILRSIKR